MRACCPQESEKRPPSRHVPRGFGYSLKCEGPAWSDTFPQGDLSTCLRCSWALSLINTVPLLTHKPLAEQGLQPQRPISGLSILPTRVESCAPRTAEVFLSPLKELQEEGLQETRVKTHPPYGTVVRKTCSSQVGDIAFNPCPQSPPPAGILNAIFHAEIIGHPAQPPKESGQAVPVLLSAGSAVGVEGVHPHQTLPAESLVPCKQEKEKPRRRNSKDGVLCGPGRKQLLGRTFARQKREMAAVQGSAGTHFILEAQVYEASPWGPCDAAKADLSLRAGHLVLGQH